MEILPSTSHWVKGNRAHYTNFQVSLQELFVESILSVSTDLLLILVNIHVVWSSNWSTWILRADLAWTSTVSTESLSQFFFYEFIRLHSNHDPTKLFLIHLTRSLHPSIEIPCNLSSPQFVIDVFLVHSWKRNSQCWTTEISWSEPLQLICVSEGLRIVYTKWSSLKWTIIWVNHVNPSLCNIRLLWRN